MEGEVSDRLYARLNAALGKLQKLDKPVEQSLGPGMSVMPATLAASGTPVAYPAVYTASAQFEKGAA